MIAGPRIFGYARNRELFSASVAASGTRSRGLRSMHHAAPPRLTGERSMVKRYRHFGEQRDCMLARGDGQYVLASDYDALARDLAACKIARDGFTAASDTAHARIRELESALLDIRNIAYLACDSATQDGADRLAALDRIYALARSQSDRGDKP